MARVFSPCASRRYRDYFVQNERNHADPPALSTITPTEPRPTKDTVDRQFINKMKVYGVDSTAYFYLQVLGAADLEQENNACLRVSS